MEIKKEENSIMKYSKKIRIKNKIIKKEDILQLSKIVEAEFSDDDYRHHFEIDFWDDSSITDGSSHIFNSDSFERKRAKRIYIEYYSNSLNKHIEITLYDSMYLDNSEITITSNEQLWYGAMITKFSDLLQNIEKQVVFASIVNSPFSIIITPTLGCILSYICVNVLSDIINGKGLVLSEITQTFIIVLVVATNFLLCVLAGKGLSRAFPTMDFCFGPDHMKAGLKTKKAASWCVATFAPSIILYLLEWLIAGK